MQLAAADHTVLVDQPLVTANQVTVLKIVPLEAEVAVGMGSVLAAIAATTTAVAQ